VTTRADQLAALARVCRQLGGRLAVVSQGAYDRLFDATPNDNDADGLSDAPFTSAHGLHWRNKVVYVVRGREEVGSIIHEMGHVFAAAHPPDHGYGCDVCHEWGWLGWEIALARQVDAMRTWSRHNVRYQIGEGGGSWGKITPERRRGIVWRRIAHAKTAGFIGPRGELRSVR
jgi:hypothetical protein